MDTKDKFLNPFIAKTFDLPKTQSLPLHLTTEERDAMLAILTKRQQETDITRLQDTLDLFEHSLKAFFSCPGKSRGNSIFTCTVLAAICEDLL
jgi:hypothetical protein